jgi:hypothetical protein
MRAVVRATVAFPKGVVKRIKFAREGQFVAVAEKSALRMAVVRRRKYTTNAVAVRHPKRVALPEHLQGVMAMATRAV